MTPQHTTVSGLDAYLLKSSEYFSGARRDYVRELPQDSEAKILEIGCGNGGTGALALSEGKCRRYCGVEIFPDAAERASKRITEVLLGNVEELELPWRHESFDTVILSEVLEHLVDPWSTLRKVHPLLKKGGLVFASSPNISHYGVIRMLLRGQWTLADSGLMDRTHLRWFTPLTYRVLFESCGYIVDSVREVTPLSRKARAMLVLTLGQFRHLFVGQIDLRAHRE